MDLRKPNLLQATSLIQSFGSRASELARVFADSPLGVLLPDLPDTKIALAEWTSAMVNKALERGLHTELVEVLGRKFPGRHEDVEKLAEALLVRVVDHPAYQELTAKAKVVLMVSVDLAHSKQLKHGSVAVYQNPWTVKFQRFYDRFPQDLQSTYDDLKPAHTRLVGRDRLELLRIDDDDLMFAVSLTLHQQVVPHLQAVIDALERFNDRRWPGLRVKATVWLCGTPVTDLEVVKPGHAPSWVGPSMDLGYSLKHWSKPSRTAVSLEVAMMICDAITDPARVTYDFELRFGSSAIPRGHVFRARYPKVWVAPRPNGALRPEDIEAIDEKAITPSDLLAYLGHYREEHGLVRWFLKDDPDERYAGPTRAWLDRYQTIEAKEREAGLDYPDE